MRSRKKIAGTLPRGRVGWLPATALSLSVATASLGGCSLPLDSIGVLFKTGTVRASTAEQMASLNMDRDAPILLRIYKSESALEVWKQSRGGKYALLKTYPICKFSGTLGPKISEGDRQAPEGFYEITPAQMNPMSREYLAFNIGFPNALDRSLGRTGSVVMVHGGCHSIGCYAMTDQNMDEIYALIGEAFIGGQDKIQLQAYPFRMIAENLVAHAENNPNAPFWAMLKGGSDAFLAEGKPPAVAVCGHRYVFNPGPAATALDPQAPCPPGIAPHLLAEGAQSAMSNFAIVAASNHSPVRSTMKTSPKRTRPAALDHKRTRLAARTRSGHLLRVTIAAASEQPSQRMVWLRRHNRQRL
jgi:murein L,D-transpeptidase YafK